MIKKTISLAITLVLILTTSNLQALITSMSCLENKQDGKKVILLGGEYTITEKLCLEQQQQKNILSNIQKRLKNLSVFVDFCHQKNLTNIDHLHRFCCHQLLQVERIYGKAIENFFPGKQNYTWFDVKESIHPIVTKLGIATYNGSKSYHEQLLAFKQSLEDKIEKIEKKFVTTQVP